MQQKVRPSDTPPFPIFPLEALPLSNLTRPPFPWPLQVPLEWLLVSDELRKLSKKQRRIDLSEVKTLAQKHGLPVKHTLDEEVSAMLNFFTSLNTVLWYDTPTLRNLVVLDPQWVIDAVCCFVRDFKLDDHSKHFERMHKVRIRRNGHASPPPQGSTRPPSPRSLSVLGSSTSAASARSRTRGR